MEQSSSPKTNIDNNQNVNFEVSTSKVNIIKSLCPGKYKKYTVRNLIRIINIVKFRKRRGDAWAESTYVTKM